MMNGKFNFILKVMFWITRQPINQVIDNPDSLHKNRRGETHKYLPSSPKLSSLGSLWGLTIYVPDFTAVLQLLIIIAQSGFRGS